LNIIGVEWKVFIVYCIAVGLLIFMYLTLLSLYNNKFSEDEAIATHQEAERADLQQDVDNLMDEMELAAPSTEELLATAWNKLRDAQEANDLEFRETHLTPIQTQKHVVCIRGLSKNQSVDMAFL